MPAPVEPMSLEEVAAAVREPLLRYLRRYVGDAAIAEDLLQETLLRIERGLAGFAGRSSVQTWAFAIATRVAADHFRSPLRRVNIVDVDEAALPADAARGLDEQLVVDEMSACVRSVIDSLPEDYRSALVLHDLEGLTADQVAEVCGCSRATAKIRIHRARARLQEALRQQCTFYRDGEDVFRCAPKSSA